VEGETTSTIVRLRKLPFSVSRKWIKRTAPTLGNGKRISKDAFAFPGFSRVFLLSCAHALMAAVSWKALLQPLFFIGKNSSFRSFKRGQSAKTH